MALAVIISGFGALTGWTMICAEMPLAAAKDGLFPERFKRMSSSQVPAFGIIASTALASVAIVINYLGSSGATVFTTLVLMTGITSAIPYAFSADRPPGHAHAALRPGHDRRRAGPGVLDLVHRLLPQHR
jgi:APA family basic amino acid/polyamine antiporter